MPTLWCREVYNVAIRLEHVDLLDRLDRLDIHLLQSCLELLVIRASALVNLLDLSPRCAFASVVVPLVTPLCSGAKHPKDARVRGLEIIWKEEVCLP